MTSECVLNIATFLSNRIFVDIFFTVYPSVDPCYNYSVLDDPWRATNNINASVRKCDTSVTWRGWYRLFINGLSAQIPDTCVEKAGCGTDIPLWIRDGHPSLQDGVVTRDVCGPWKNYCCFYGSYPIKVKACPGNYYVYELITPTYCNYSYCAGNYIYMISDKGVWVPNNQHLTW
uniref:UMOD/GP2/OIT3-like D8C domain-containing protein n=1 Tax=Cyprinus carpio TaxID=7962 RepID=A0A8C2JUT8_CYPCA